MLGETAREKVRIDYLTRDINAAHSLSSLV